MTMAMPRRWRKFWKWLQRLGKIRASMRLGALQAGEEARELALPRGGPDVLAHFIIEND